MASQLAHMSRPGMASESSELKAHAEQSDARHSLHEKVHTIVPACECDANVSVVGMRMAYGNGMRMVS